MAEVVIKDPSGSDCSYPMKPKIRLKTSDGDKVIYSKGEAVEGVEIDLDFTDGDQTVTPESGTLIKSAVINKPEMLIPENVRNGVDIGGISGTFIGDTEEITVPLSMANGDQIIEPSEAEKVLSKVTISKPPTLVPENIKAGIVVAGIEGTCGDLPQLKSAGSITAQTANGLKYIQVYDNNNNGTFTRVLQIVTEDDSLVLAQTANRASSGYVNMYGYNFIAKPSVMPFKVCARFMADKFLPSNMTALAKSYYLVSILKNLLGCSLDKDYPYLFSGDEITFTIVPDDGYYIPKAILIEPSEGEVVYSYDAPNGAISLTMPEVDSISISAEAPTSPWLQTPVITQAENDLTIKFIDSNAEQTPVIYNGEALVNLVDSQSGYVSHSVTSPANNATYGFSLQSDGYYKEATNGTNYSAALCRVDLVMKTAGTVRFYCVNYGYSSYSYGIIGKVDCTLSTSYSTDIDTTSSNVYKVFKSSNSTAIVSVDISVPAGAHFIYFKFRRYSTTSTSYYFKFKVYSTPSPATVYDMDEYLPSYGTFPVMIQSLAEGYTPSDALEFTFTSMPRIEISNALMTVSHIINGVSLEMFVDGESIAVLDCADIESTEIDLTQYGLSIAAHSVYVAITDTNGDVWNSNTVDDAVCFAHETFANAEFSEIDAVSRAGFASKVYAVGNTKTVTIGDVERTMRIIGLDIDELADGSGKAGITFCVYPVNYSCYYQTAYYKGWDDSYPRKYLLNTFPSLVPEELQSILKTVNKKYFYFPQTQKYETVQDTWFIPSCVEAGGTACDEGTGIYYPGFDTASERIMKNTSGTAVVWHTRTSQNTYNYRVSATGGSTNATMTTNSCYVLPCACI